MATPLSSLAKDVSCVFPLDGALPPSQQFSPVVQREYLIDGELRAWQGPLQDVQSCVCLRDPKDPTTSTRQYLVGSYPLLTSKESLEALSAAQRAMDRGSWARASVAERISCTQRFVVMMKAQREVVVRLLMHEIGKALDDSCREFDRTLAYIIDTIDALKDLDRANSRFTVSQGIAAQVRRAPLGVVLCMGPSNYPLNETFTTLIPALIMGNTVIFKPPKLGVLLHAPLLGAFRECFPPGVVNTIYGDGSTVVSPLMASGGVSVLAFIGSSRVADIIKKQHPKPHRLRSILGLEAKNCAIVMPDADLDLAVQECVLGSLSYNGMRCTALKAIWVHKALAPKFVPALVDRIQALKAGCPWDNPDVTPLPDLDTVGRVKALLEDAVSKGARVLNQGGGRVFGTFFHPAVVTDVTSSMRLYTEEQWGPIIEVHTFFDTAEPLRFIEESVYGQQCSVFGRDSSVVASLVDNLVNMVCRVNINSQCQRGPDILPFTGRKDSAEGTLSVSDALRCFSIRTLVAAKLTDRNSDIITDIVQHRKSKFLSTDFIL